MYWKHSSELEVANNKNSEVLMTSRNNARIYGTLEAQKEALARRWEDEQRKYENSEKLVSNGEYLELHFISHK